MAKVNIVNNSNNPLPSYATEGSSGVDLYAYLDEDLILRPMERKLVPTGIYLSIPKGYECQVRARSGLAFRHGVTILNGIGTIDSDYRGEIGVLLINLSAEAYRIKSGDKIAQLVLAKYETMDWEEKAELDVTRRSSGGFGHTGY